MPDLRTLAGGFARIRRQRYQIADAERALKDNAEALLTALAEQMLVFEDRLLALTQRIEVIAQPEVAQNTGSGAAPEAPDAHQASDGADAPPAAAGTAPKQALQVQA